MLPAIAYLHALVVHRLHRSSTEHGQTTAEYALVLLGAAAIALLVVAWTARSNRIGRLLDAILDTILSKVQ
jgi:hypothetical protein